MPSRQLQKGILAQTTLLSADSVVDTTAVGPALAVGLASPTVQRQHGLQLDGKTYAWNSIQDIQVDDGRLKVTLRAGQKHEARVSAIPNIEVLCQLIGVKLESAFGLGHWV